MEPTTDPISPSGSPSTSPTTTPTDAPSMSPTNAPSMCDCASVSAHCANELTVYYAVDGVNFIQVAYNTNWREETRLFFEDINIDSVLRFSCDGISRDGGFIASLDYKEIIYSTTYPLSVGGFEVVASSDRILAPPLLYHPDHAL
eukprot:771481_1